MPYLSGRHFLQIPGPTNVPEQVLRAMAKPTIDHRGPAFKALAAAITAKLPKSYWGWEEMLTANRGGFFPSSPATNLLYGLREALRLLQEEGIDNVFARHIRHGEATRRAVRTWGLEILCLNPEEYSPVLTTVVMPGNKGADAYRDKVLEKFNMCLGSGLGILKDRIFRIGHLGDFNDLTLIGTLGGVEMGFAVAGVPYQKGGVMAAMDYLVK
jgi:alanine-glyoxylate transaminase/serine-glyoxylate transaminase/serine-pyruvate transaminase